MKTTVYMGLHFTKLPWQWHPCTCK